MDGVNEALLRGYIRNALIAELKIDRKFLATLQASNVNQKFAVRNSDAQRFVEEWIYDNDLDSMSSKVERFVHRRWKGLLKRFKGDKDAVKQTLANLLDDTFGV